MNVLAYVHLRNIYRSTGVGRVTRELTEHLAKRPDVNLKVLADRGDYNDIIPKVGGPWAGYDFRFFKHETSRQQMLWFALNRPPAEGFWPKVDVVYCPAESYVPVRRAKLAITSHDMQIFDPEAYATNRWVLQQRFKWKLLFRKLERKADLFVTVSQFSAERMAHFFPSTKGRVCVVPNAVSNSFYQQVSKDRIQQLRTKLGLEDRPYVLVPGGLHYRKNADLILKVWPVLHEQMPELSLVIPGHNSPEYLPHAQSFAPSVVLAGFQEEQDLVALYSDAEAVWFPSRYEGFGMPVVEAMACGAPVVTSSTSALPEVTGGAAAALVHPDKPQDHIDALVSLLRDAPARAKASELGRIRASQFTWDRSTEVLVQAFKQSLS